MNNRNGVFIFFLFVFVLAIISMQILSMIQSDRVYERINRIVDIVENAGSFTAGGQQNTNASADGDQYPGDEGDWLVRSIGGEPRTLNPYSVDSSLSARWIHTPNIFERLFEYDLDFDGVKLKPWLAESMEISEDGLEVTVRLKKDIWFSDHVPITADDVIFTYETIMNPGVDAAATRNYYSNFKELVKLDERTVKFVCNEVYWKTLETVGIFEVIPKHIYQFDNPEEFNDRRSDPVGSGPYVFERWDVGQQVVLRSNKNYWGKKPKIKKKVYKFITNRTAELQAFRAHEIDLMEPTSEQFAEMSNDEEFKKEFNVLSYWEPAGGYSFIGWNQATPFFKDKRVRLAMTHVIDRESILKYVLKGYGSIVTGPFYMHGRQSNPDIKPWPYDPERAKELLDEAGWVDSDDDGIRDKDGVPFKFKYCYVPGGPSSERIAKILKDGASKVGIEVIPDPAEWSIFVDRLNNRKLDAGILMWGGTIESDPYQIWHSSQIEGRGSNFINFNSPEADAIIEEARRTLDEGKRYELYHKFHKLLHEEQPYTFLFARPEPRFIDKRFKNVKIHILGLDEHEWYVPKHLQKYK
jgi:peptide/nickel transport system substrate-binding protein